MEELKLLIELFSKISDGAVTLIILYYIKGFLTSGLIAGVVIYLIKNLVSLIKNTTYATKIANIIGEKVFENITNERKQRILKYIENNKEEILKGTK